MPNRRDRLPNEKWDLEEMTGKEAAFWVCVFLLILFIGSVGGAYVLIGVLL